MQKFAIEVYMDGRLITTWPMLTMAQAIDTMHILNDGLKDECDLVMRPW